MRVNMLEDRNAALVRTEVVEEPLVRFGPKQYQRRYSQLDRRALGVGRN